MAPKKITSSSNRSARSKASANRAAAKSTSSGKNAGKTSTVDNRVQRQKVSKAKVTSSGGGTKGSARVTTSGVYNNPGKGPGGSRANTNATKGGKASGASGRMSRITKASAAARTSTKIKGIGAKGGAAAVAYETLKARPVADGTTKGKPNVKYGPAFNKPATGYKAGTFNDAFKAAKSENRKVFTWQGKKYTTKVK